MKEYVPAISPSPRISYLSSTMAPSQTQDENITNDKSSDLLKHSKEESVLTDKDRKGLAFTDKHSSPDVYISYNKDTLWHPWTGTLELKPLRYETRSGSFVVALRTPVDAWLGKHRHRGTVTAVTLAGNWRYKEYDWVAGPGDYIVENPGTIHTLFMGAGSEVVFTITGSLEFFHDDDSLKETMDIFSFAQLYYDHCEEKGVEPNPNLWY
jgi:2,4'-dihydroxyacetophenone dioxygenase